MDLVTYRSLPYRKPRHRTSSSRQLHMADVAYLVSLPVFEHVRPLPRLDDDVGAWSQYDKVEVVGRCICPGCPVLVSGAQAMRLVAKGFG